MDTLSPEQVWALMAGGALIGLLISVLIGAATISIGVSGLRRELGKVRDQLAAIADRPTDPTRRW